MHAYMDTIIISGVEHKGQRNISTGKILVPTLLKRMWESEMPLFKNQVLVK